MIRLAIVPVAGKTDTTPLITDFDPNTLEFRTAPGYDPEFYEDDLKEVSFLQVEDTTSIWDPASDTTYEIIRIS